jgi:hypothetical protein
MAKRGITMREKVKKSQPLHPDLDITKPINVDKITAQLDVDDCYGYEWMPDHVSCCMCAAKDICGIIYNERQKNYIKQRDKEHQYLDVVRFDEIEPDDMITWLAYKPRSGKQFIDKVQKFSECSDRVTCQQWVKSFLIDHADVLSVEVIDGVKTIIVNQ